VVVDSAGFEPSRESVNILIARMTGITFGAAHCALRLLLPGEISGRALSEAPVARIVRTFQIEGKTRFAIRLHGWSADEIIVDNESLLCRVGTVRRDVQQTPAIGHARFGHVLAYAPELFAQEDPGVSLDW